MKTITAFLLAAWMAVWPLGANPLSILAGSPPVAGGVASLSDNFDRADSDSLGANWTEATGDLDIASNSLRAYSNVYAIGIYSGSALSSVNGYALFTIVELTAAAETLIIFRYTSSGSPYYELAINNNADTHVWRYCPSVGSASTTIATQYTRPVALSDKYGVTWTGTGTSTVVRVWKNPTATAPVSAGEWDSGDTTPDTVFTTDPASPVDTGNYVGFAAYQNYQQTTRVDDFYAGAL